MLPDPTGREMPAPADLDLAAPWPRLTVEEAFRRYSPLSLDQAMAGDCFEEILVEFVEPHLGVRSPGVSPGLSCRIGIPGPEKSGGTRQGGAF